MSELDPRLTFDTYVVGPANRLASAAARRAADSPGTTYNPLFLYSASGLGKSHILNAVAHHAGRVHPERSVVYMTLEGYLDQLTRSLGTGEDGGLREGYRNTDLLLLDDVQFVTGQPQAQEMLLKTLDALTSAGRQVVLASDRPPAEINGLDERLLSRFSGGLIVDIGPPEYETRVAILRRKAEEKGVQLQPGVAEMTARIPYRNVRELQGALNRVLAVQELEGRPVGPEEVRKLLRVDELKGGSGSPGEAPRSPEGPGAPHADPAEVVAEDESWRLLLQEAVDRAEAEGFAAGRLRGVLEGEREPADPEGLVHSFQDDLDQLQRLGEELEELGERWSGPGPSPFRDPERLGEAEGFLLFARERRRPFPEIPAGPDLTELGARFPALALRAADRLVSDERSDFNPLFLVCSHPGEARELLQAVARSFLFRKPGTAVGIASAPEFAEEFIATLATGVAPAWRERWGGLDLLLMDGAEALSETERAQDEFFHVFEALKRRGSRIVLAADRPPSEIQGIDDRLRSRFEGGLVVELHPPRGDEPEPPPLERGEGAGEGGGVVTPAETGRAAEGGEGLPLLGDFDLRDDGRGGLFHPDDALRQAVEAEREAEPPPPPDVPMQEAPSGAELTPPSLPPPPSPRIRSPEGHEIPHPPAPAPPEPPAAAVAAGGVLPAPPEPHPPSSDWWFPSGEKVVWEWPRMDDRVVEDGD